MERISFTRPSAARIARVVRIVENARPGGRPLETQRQDTLAKASVFRVCTYTGAWAIGSAKTVTFKNRTTTPNTVSATNLFFPITSTAAGNRDCAIAKDGTAWFLIDVKLATASAVFCSHTTQAVATSITTALITYLSGVSASLNTSSCTVSVSPVTATASAVAACNVYSFAAMSNTFTAHFLKMPE